MPNPFCSNEVLFFKKSVQDKYTVWIQKKKNSNLEKPQFSSIWPLDGTLSDATTPCQSGPGSDSSKGVLCVLQRSSITGPWPSDCVVSHPGHTLGGWSYSSAEMHFTYTFFSPSWLGIFLGSWMKRNTLDSVMPRYTWDLLLGLGAWPRRFSQTSVYSTGTNFRTTIFSCVWGVILPLYFLVRSRKVYVRELDRTSIWAL